MTVGPNSDMVIDTFVFDPTAGTGKFAANLTRGVFRFVGGKLSKQENAVTMTTPVATIGIRVGSSLLISPRRDARCYFRLWHRRYRDRSGGVSQTITRPGFQVTVSGPGCRTLGAISGAARRHRRAACPARRTLWPPWRREHGPDRGHRRGQRVRSDGPAASHRPNPAITKCEYKSSPLTSISTPGATHGPGARATVLPERRARFSTFHAGAPRSLPKAARSSPTARERSLPPRAVC